MAHLVGRAHEIHEFSRSRRKSSLQDRDLEGTLDFSATTGFLKYWVHGI